jgi:hypothetical protein
MASIDGDDRQLQFVVLSMEVLLIIASKYRVIFLIDLSLPLLAADGGRQPHTFNCNG